MRVAWAVAALLASGLGAQAQKLVPDLRKYNIQIEYYAPRDAAYQQQYETLRQRKVLEELGQFLASVKWPRTLHLVVKQCPQANLPSPPVFYAYEEYSLVICYQWFTFLQTAAATTDTGGRNASFATAQEVVVGGLVGVVLHEAARAMFDMLQVPILGSNEDAADQLSGFIALQFGRDVARTVVKGTYLVWNTYAYQALANNVSYNFASQSKVPPQRADNILCMAYGGDATGFQDFVDKKLLLPTRASDCANEYRQAKQAFDATIKPHLDQALMGQALSMTWITPADLKGK